MGVQRFTDLRAWQTCNVYKNAVYRLCREGTLSRDLRLRRQLEDAVAAATSNIAEGFGRFSPPDFARFVVIARASLIESQNHLRDAVDKEHITEEVRVEHDQLAETALRETTGLIEYLQSPEALRNARRAREHRMATRDQRRAARAAANPQPRTGEPRTAEPRTAEPRTAEPRTAEPRSEPEHEPGTRNQEE
jgi:four helix bundle protein